MLDEHQLATAKAIVRDTAPGRYSLKELYGDYWQEVRRPRAYGRWFRLSVLHEDLPGVRWARRRSNKSHEYDVLPRSKAAQAIVDARLQPRPGRLPRRDRYPMAF